MRRIAVAFAAVLVAGCTTTDEIIIDRQGVNMTSYKADLAECETYADQVRTAAKTARGAGSGAAVGGVVGAIAGGSRDSTARGAGLGAISGGLRGVNEGEREELQVVKRCLRGRGYRVLN